MLKDYLKRVDNLQLLKDGITYIAEPIKTELTALLENSYFAPSYIISENSQVQNLKKVGYWLELKFNKEEKFKEYSFDSLLIPIKPKCNWLTLYRGINGVYEGKCLNLNLSNKTTHFYNQIKNFKGVENNEK